MRSHEHYRTQAQVAGFIDAEVLGESPGYDSVKRSILESSGAAELNPRVLMQMRIVFMEWRKSLRGNNGR